MNILFILLIALSMILIPNVLIFLDKDMKKGKRIVFSTIINFCIFIVFLILNKYTFKGLSVKLYYYLIFYIISMIGCFIINRNVSTNKGIMINRLIFLLLISLAITTSFIPLFNNLKFGLDLQGGFEILYKVNSIDGSPMDSEKIKATYKTLLKRIDSLGVSEPEIEIEGNDKIRVKLAGVKNPDEARNTLSSVATLSFRDTNDQLLMSSDVLKAGGAKLSQDQSGNPAVALSVKDKNKFYEVTNKLSKSENKLMVVWLDYNELFDSYKSEGNLCGTKKSNCLSAATVSQGFASDVIIQGNFTKEEASNLVDLINSGSLPAKLTEISSNTVGASFGDATLTSTLYAGIIAIILIMLFLIVVYHFVGLISSISMLLYTFLAFATFWTVGGVLTLPGIAALVLGVGMAVDSNVITFSRIKDELHKGKSLPMAFSEGSKESFSAILDSNLTTLIIAVIMFIFGESSIKGFATMLIITVLVTMFTMVFITRIIMSVFVKSNYFNDKLMLFINVKESNIPDIKKNEKIKYQPFKNTNFLKHSKLFIAISSILIVVGGLIALFYGFKLSIDYEAGTSISIITNEKVDNKNITSSLNELGLDARKININKNQVDIRVKSALDGNKVKSVKSYFENKYKAKVNIGVVTNIVKQELIKNATLAIILSFIGIIIYVGIRFKFSYAIGGVVALLHDVAMMFAMFAIFRLELGSLFIAAVLAIIGYSINDTIVVFDRIRENLDGVDYKKITALDLVNICNQSIASTFGRTIYTTFTTLLPIIALTILASSGIMTFNIAMLIGLIAGTYSSVFIAGVIFIAIETKKIKNK